MPQTVNGVGTHYYGKKNLETYQGVCQHCGQTAELSSYETRLWFVVLFIPIIPLGRKQIVDYCPHCTYHYSVSVDEWQKMGREAMQESMNEMGEKPDDPEAAMKLHQSTWSFGSREDAGELAKYMEEQFGDNVDVLLYLAGWYEATSQPEEADRVCERALAEEPENPVARRSVAIGRIEQGRLDEARELLTCMKEEGPHQEPGALFLLARAYQDAGQHEKAHEIFQWVCELFPEVARREKGFRKAVRQTEKVLAQKETILPKPPLSPWKVVAVVLVVGVVGAFAGLSYYVKGRQKLHVVNGLPVTATVSLPGEETVKVGAGGRKVVVLPEGDYTATVTTETGETEQVEVAIHNGFWRLFNRDTVFVLNVAGASVLVWQEATYRPAPENGEMRHRVHLGERFLVLECIDYAFQDMPQQVRAEPGSTVIRRAVTVLEQPVPQTVQWALLEGLPPGEVMGFAETHLTYQPGNEAVAEAYANAVLQAGAAERGAAFLRKGLSRYPVNVQWHRSFQNLRRLVGEDEELPALYDRFLSEHPEDASLLYLRARVEPDPDRALGFLEKGIRMDPKNPYPVYARGYEHALQGRWRAALGDFRRAARLKPGMAHVERMVRSARFALKDYGALEREARESIRQGSFMDTVELMQVLMLRGDRAGIEAAVARCQRRISEEMPGDPYKLIPFVRAKAAWCLQDFDAYEQRARRSMVQGKLGFDLFYALLLTDRPKEAQTALEGKSDVLSSMQQLLLRLGWRRVGNEAEAEAALKRALDIMKKGSRQDRLAATLIEEPPGDAMEALRSISTSPQQLALICVTIADLHPEHREAMLERAEKLNVIPEPPYHIIRRAIERIRKGE